MKITLETTELAKVLVSAGYCSNAEIGAEETNLEVTPEQARKVLRATAQVES